MRCVEKRVGPAAVFEAAARAASDKLARERIAFFSATDARMKELYTLFVIYSPVTPWPYDPMAM